MWELSDSVTKIHLHGHPTERTASLSPQEGAQPLDFIGCLGKCQLLAPKGFIWRSSLRKEEDEVCIHVPFQWEMVGSGDMSIDRKRKVGGVLLFCFPDGLIQRLMYHDQNKHTRFLSFTAYFASAQDVFILPSKVHFYHHSGLNCLHSIMLPGCHNISILKWANINVHLFH